jgi:integrase
LFPDPASGGYLKHDKFSRQWKKALVKAGLCGRRLTPHGLRHFGATAMATAGATLQDLKLWLGDSSTEAVARYLHSVDRNKHLANKIEFI